MTSFETSLPIILISKSAAYILAAYNTCADELGT